MQNQTSPSSNIPTSQVANQKLIAIFERIKLVMKEPKGCWSSIKSESSDVKTLYMNFVLPAVGASALASIVGISIWGLSALGVTVRPGFGYALQFGITMFLSQCIGVFVSAQIFSLLSAKFGGQMSVNDGAKLVAYSMSPALLSGLIYLLPIPGVSLVSIALNIYSIYILFCGIEPMSGVPSEKKGIFGAASILSSIVAMFLVNMILTSVLGGASNKPADFSSSKIDIGDTSIDTKQLEDFAKSLEKFAPKN